MKEPCLMKGISDQEKGSLGRQQELERKVYGTRKGRWLKGKKGRRMKGGQVDRQEWESKLRAHRSGKEGRRMIQGWLAGFIRGMSGPLLSLIHMQAHRGTRTYLSKSTVRSKIDGWWDIFGISKQSSPIHTFCHYHIEGKYRCVMIL